MRCFKRVTALALTAGVVCGATRLTAATLFYDFGATATPTGGNYNDVFPAASYQILNSIDSAGAPTGISLTSEGFNELGPNTNGTTAPGAPANVFSPEATRDNLFGHTDNFNAGSPRPFALVTLAGLDGSGATSYAFTFFASRTGVTDNRETQYHVVGLNSGDGFLNASANTSNVAVVSGITPTAAGQIVITVDPGPNNNHASGFFYLGAMQVVSTRVPEPAAAALLLVGLAAAARRRRR